VLLMQAASLHVRAARDADARAVVTLLEDEGLEIAFDPREFLVAEIDGAVIACARLRTFPSGAHELASVAVAPARRGAGIGARVVRDALGRAVGAVYALALAPSFFEKVGFSQLLVMPQELEQKAREVCASTGAMPMRWVPSPEAAVAEIRHRYAHAAKGDACCVDVESYSDDELASLPEGAHLGLGTGNPVREARLAPGEVVLDLGCGAGGDLLLAARAVGPTGRAIGVDFTPEMVARARESVARAEATNVEVHESPIERLPLAEGSVDVIVSNCVINLSVDKPAVLREAHRVLRPSGRFVVSDTLRIGRLGVVPQNDAEKAGPAGHAGLTLLATPTCDCTGGALSAAEWRTMLAEAGFSEIQVDQGPTRGATGTATVRARK
jgi:SAM-dependent methyltransferase/N-acetylglutamate synthase-like GNAT family acetyltransferase